MGLIFIYFLLFPFGKLLGNVSDLVVIGICILFCLKKRKKSVRSDGKQNFNSFLLICVFSLLFSLSFFKVSNLFVGLLYLVRLFSYFLFSKVVYEVFGKNNKSKKLIINSLIVSGVFIAIFGWIQYFVFPDLRALKALGWDDHYFRLASTFLDPAFTGILLVLTEILVIIKTIEKKSKVNYVLNIFLITTVLFTYSRASFLALFFALIFLFFKFRRRFIFFLVIMILILIPVLPRESSEGTNLTRTYSINQKFVNYSESIELIKKSPLFGLGFDNLCVAKNKFIGATDTTSHTCSGLDNSILFIVATTGTTGLMLFTDMIYKMVKNTKLDMYGWGLVASLSAIFIHGMFTNTFFYNFVMGYVAILVGITRKEFVAKTRVKG